MNGRWRIWGLASILTCVVAEASPTFFGQVLADWDHTWRYETANTNLAPFPWMALDFDDGTWSEGPGVFAFPLNEPLLPGLTNRTQLPVAQGRLTQYFHTVFNWDRPEQVFLTFSNLIDDGAVFYLNGQEIQRVRMPIGPIDGTTLATRSREVLEGFDVFTIVNPPLIQGLNLLAVEVHQNSPTSGDMVFGCYVRADQARPPCGWLPTKRVALTLLACTSTNFSVEIDGYPEPVLQWFKDGAEISGATNPVYTLTNINPQDEGVYVCKEFSPLGTCDLAVYTLTVVIDSVSPYVEQVVGLINRTNIRVRFSHPMDETSAEDIFSYSIPDLEIESADLDASLREVLLTTEPRIPGQFYTIEISGITGGLTVCDGTFTHVMVPTRRRIDLETRVLPFDAPWKYHDQGIDLGTAWRQTQYDDSLWPTGPALLGFEGSQATLDSLAAQGLTVQTPLNVSTGPTGFPMTYYFRTWVNVPFPVARVMTLRHVVDDGAAFYANGLEMARFNLPDGPIVYGTPGIIAPVEGVIQSVPINGLVQGTNLICVEVHQASIVGGDILFGAEIIGLVAGEDAPVLKMDRSSDGALVLSWAGSAVLEETTGFPATWSRSSNQTNPQIIPNPTAMRFYRLRW